MTPVNREAAQIEVITLSAEVAERALLPASRDNDTEIARLANLIAQTATELAKN